jgi:hypothetical protein
MSTAVVVGDKGGKVLDAERLVDVHFFGSVH